MLLVLWSPKGGSGTSVVAASVALEASARSTTCLVDLGGDQHSILGLPPAPPWPGPPIDGLAGWLAYGPSSPTEWLDDLMLPVVPGLSILPRGTGALDDATPEAGAALGVALRDGVPAVVDAASPAPAVRAIVDVADQALLVVRPCYLALRRAVADPRLAQSAGAVLVDEPGRVLDADDVAAVLDVPVIGRFPVRPEIARAVDAGVLRDRLPAALAAPAAALLDEVANAIGGQWAA